MSVELLLARLRDDPVLHTATVNDICERLSSEGIDKTRETFAEINVLLESTVSPSLATLVQVGRKYLSILEAYKAGQLPNHSNPFSGEYKLEDDLETLQAIPEHKELSGQVVNLLKASTFNLQGIIHRNSKQLEEANDVLTKALEFCTLGLSQAAVLSNLNLVCADKSEQSEKAALGAESKQWEKAAVAHAEKLEATAKALYKHGVANESDQKTLAFVFSRLAIFHKNRTRDFSDVEDMFAKSYELYPTSNIVYNNYGIFLLKQGTAETHLDKSIAIFDEVIAKDLTQSLIVGPDYHAQARAKKLALAAKNLKLVLREYNLL
jgi:hypothetical protein